MLNNVLANFYERDFRKLIEELNLFKNESNIWKTQGSIKNSAGNLALHLIGGTNHFFGATLARTGYIRKRDEEFARKGVPRQVLVAEIEGVIPIVKAALSDLTDAQMSSPFPIMFDDENNSHEYVLVRLLAHVSYHLGQINYLRRILEP